MAVMMSGERALEELLWRPHAQRMAETEMMRGYLTADEIMDVWRRHPLWAPGGRYGPCLPSSPVDSMLSRFWRTIRV